MPIIARSFVLPEYCLMMMSVPSLKGKFLQTRQGLLDSFILTKRWMNLTFCDRDSPGGLAEFTEGDELRVYIHLIIVWIFAPKILYTLKKERTLAVLFCTYVVFGHLRVCLYTVQNSTDNERLRWTLTFDIQHKNLLVDWIWRANPNFRRINYTVAEKQRFLSFLILVVHKCWCNISSCFFRRMHSGQKRSHFLVLILGMKIKIPL